MNNAGCRSPRHKTPLTHRCCTGNNSEMPASSSVARTALLRPGVSSTAKGPDNGAAAAAAAAAAAGSSSVATAAVEAADVAAGATSAAAPAARTSAVGQWAAAARSGAEHMRRWGQAAACTAVDDTATEVRAAASRSRDNAGIMAAVVAQSLRRGKSAAKGKV